MPASRVAPHAGDVFRTAPPALRGRAHPGALAAAHHRSREDIPARPRPGGTGATSRGRRHHGHRPSPPFRRPLTNARQRSFAATTAGVPNRTGHSRRGDASDRGDPQPFMTGPARSSRWCTPRAAVCPPSSRVIGALRPRSGRWGQDGDPSAGCRAIDMPLLFLGDCRVGLLGRDHRGQHSGRS
jgi:hypothetical protein